MRTTQSKFTAHSCERRDLFQLREIPVFTGMSDRLKLEDGAPLPHPQIAAKAVIHA